MMLASLISLISIGLLAADVAFKIHHLARG